MKYLALLVPALLAACAAPRSVTPAGEEAQIRVRQDELARAFARRDPGAALRCYAADAVLMLPGQPALTGREAIGKALQRAFADPRITIEARTTRIEIANSAELAYAFGTGLTTLAGAAGEGATRSSSKWLAVFRKSDGVWEIVADAYNEDSGAGTR
jgi:uncharacterized protein (TIGR02246 family)